MNKKVLYEAYRKSRPSFTDSLKFLSKSIKTKSRYYLKSISPLDIDEISIGKMNFFYSFEDRKKYVKYVKSFYRKSIKKTVKEADKICRNTFNLLGSGNKSLGKDINWRKDFKSGYIWNLDFFTKIDIDPTKNADIKVPWELSRFQFSSTLGKAYWYTNNKKYLQKWKSLVLDWIEKNPVEYGPNWKCAMDVSIRAINMLIGYFFFEKDLDEEFKEKIYKSLYIHGLFIEDNVEWRPVRSNHYIANVVGLIYLGLFFDNKEWLDFGINEIKKEINNQVLEDGVSYETSISYHRLVTEMFLSAAIVLRKNKIRLSTFFMNRLEKMVVFVLNYTKPNGLAPMIGDNDDGRLHIFSENEMNDHRYLISIGSVLFKNDYFKNHSNGFNEEAFWLLGLEGNKAFKKIRKKKSGLKSKAFKQSGFYIMRSGKNYLIVKCGKNGLNGLGSHNHNDQLSFELNVKGKDIIVDPGAYIYNGDKKSRNLFRSTKMHNTITIDGKEQNIIYPDVTFYLRDDTYSKNLKFKDEKNKVTFEGEHYGYQRLKHPIIHKRKISLEKKNLIITEYLEGEGNHLIEIFFHLEIGTKIKRFKDSVKIGSAFLEIPEGFEMKIIDGMISKSYGKKQKSKTIVFKKKTDLPKIINYKIKVA